MNPQARAAADRLLGLLEAASEECPAIDEGIDEDLRTVLAELGDPPPVLHAVSGLCTWKSCTLGDHLEIYRMIGTCANCHGGPYLMLFTVGHERHALNCPACGTQNVRGTRLATADEIGTTAAGDDERIEQ